MATLKEFRNERLRKLEELKALGFNPYPANAKRTNVLSEIKDKFDELSGKEVTVVGRLQGIRKFGKIAFLVVKDASGSLQLFLDSGKLGEAQPKNNQLGIKELPLLDSGDFIQATGIVSKTQTGEISIEVASLRLLSKSLRPLPAAHEGFSNKEERLRRRYLDLNMNQDVQDRFIRRSKFWQLTRDFLNKEGFTEINIPVLEHTTGGADAAPFVTHMDALNEDFYLRISHELPLKRLIGGGYEKVYDIGPRFRNENYSEEHLPEHVAMEWYWAYANWRDGMNLTKEMFKTVLNGVYGKLQFKIHDFEVNLDDEWQEIDYAEIMKKNFGLDIFNCNLEDVKKQLADRNIEVEKSENKNRGIDKLWKTIRGTIKGPAFLVNIPVFISPLAKTSPDNSNIVERFQPIIGGVEVANGFSELNDPVEQLNRFKEQQEMKDAGDKEAMMLDIDYVEMLEYGMPPTCGYGESERVFWTFEGVTAREGVVFPQLRYDVDEVTRSIYPDINFNKG